MTEISIEALKLRKRELEINVAMNQGALEEINHIIAEMERRRGGRPRKTENISLIPQRVAGGSADTEVEDNMHAIDEVRGILKEDA